jgi:hypothetical protein
VYDSIAYAFVFDPMAPIKDRAAVIAEKTNILFVINRFHLPL